MYSTSTSTVHCTVQSVVLFGLGSILFGGGGACTLYSTECIIIVLLGSILFGGLKPPQALMTRRPWVHAKPYHLYMCMIHCTKIINFIKGHALIHREFNTC